MVLLWLWAGWWVLRKGLRRLWLVLWLWLWWSLLVELASGAGSPRRGVRAP